MLRIAAALAVCAVPLLDLPAQDFARVTPEQACAHPNWSMGRKISVDSATLMNKGLEVIEARWLFGVSPRQIEVVVHPQSIVHSMVGFVDGSVLAQLGIPDMKGPIAYALAYPDRIALGLDYPDFTALANLTFEPPDLNRFPCLALAMDACTQGGTLPAVLNAANEIAVNAFLKRHIAFPDIHRVIDATMARHAWQNQPDLEQIREADRLARIMANEEIQKCNA